MKEEIKKEVLEEIYSLCKINISIKYKDCIEKATVLAIQKTVERIFKDLEECLDRENSKFDIMEFEGLKQKWMKK